MRTKLEVIANVVTIAFVACALAIYSKSYLSSPSQSVTQSSEVQILKPKVGDLLPALAGYSWNSHPRTLVLGLKNGCHFCEASAPFYSRLAQLVRDKHDSDVHILAIFPDTADVVQQTLVLENLSLDSVPSVDFHQFKIGGTPTVLLADQSGRVLKVWVGELPVSQQQLLLESLGLS